jgi:hypothetical protein
MIPTALCLLVYAWLPGAAPGHNTHVHVAHVVCHAQLGYFFGVVPSMLRNRSLGLWRTWASDGWRSAGGLGIVSGAYTWVHCLCSRIRLVDDAWNRAVAGCTTGLILGWKSGPMAAAQSALGFGLVSYLFDFGSAAEVPAAKAEALLGAPCCSVCAAGPEPQCCSSNGRSSSSKGAADACSGSGCNSSSSSSSKGAQAAGCHGCCSNTSHSCSSCLVSRPRGPAHNRLVSVLKPKPLSPQAVLATPPVVWLGQLMQQPVH